MDVRLPHPQDVGGAEWPHDWRAYEEYKSVHRTYMTTLENEGIVEEDGLSFIEVRDGRRLQSVVVSGEIRCANGLLITVDKTLAVQGAYVKGEDYSYHAWIEETEQSVLRYDMAHESTGLHCHVFDPKTGKETIFPVDRDSALPTLDAFIRLAFDRAKEFRGQAS